MAVAELGSRLNMWGRGLACWDVGRRKRMKWVRADVRSLNQGTDELVAVWLEARVLPLPVPVTVLRRAQKRDQKPQSQRQISYVLLKSTGPEEGAGTMM